MIRFDTRLVGVAIMVLSTTVANSSVLFYGGDQRTDVPAPQQFLIFGPGDSGTIVLDDFIVTSETWSVSRMSFRFASNAGFAPAYGQYEIRSNVSEGHGGILLYEDEAALVSMALTGRFLAGVPEYEMSIDVSGISLQQGRYWLGMRPFGDGVITPSTGANSVGSPILNGSSFARSIFQGYNYRSMESITGFNPFDLSFKIEGTAVPEPAALASLALGSLASLRRRDKRNNRF